MLYKQGKTQGLPSEIFCLIHAFALSLAEVHILLGDLQRPQSFEVLSL